MKFIVLFSLLGLILNSAFAAERLESEITLEDKARVENQNSFAGLVETTMELLGPDSSTVQNSEQVAAKTNK